VILLFSNRYSLILDPVIDKLEDLQVYIILSIFKSANEFYTD